jgi:hypothetical protein
MRGLLKELENTISRTDEYLQKPNFSRLTSNEFEPMIHKQNSDLRIVMDSEKKQQIVNIKK